MLGAICVSTLIANVVDLSGFDFKEQEFTTGLTFKEENDLNDISVFNLSEYPLKEL